MFIKSLKEEGQSFCEDLRFFWADRDAGIIAKVILTFAVFILFCFNLFLKEERE